MRSIKRFFWISIALLAGCLLVFLWENSFLFTFHRVRPGIPKSAVKSLLGLPSMEIGYVRGHQSDKEWRNFTDLQGEECWVYKVGFCGLHPGECLVRFVKNEVSRTDLSLFSIRRHVEARSNQSLPMPGKSAVQLLRQSSRPYSEK